MNKKLSISLLIALVGFPQISETIYTPALPDVAKSLNATPSAVEQTLSIYFLGFAFGVLLWGAISDRIGRKLTALMGLLIYGGATYLCGSATTVESLLFWRFFQALGASIGSVITMTIIRDVYQGNEKTRLFSLISAALAFSPAIGPLMGGWISEIFGWSANFGCLCLVAAVLFIWCFLRLYETRPAHTELVSSKTVLKLSRNMLTSANLWGHILLIGGANGIIFGFYQEAPFIFIEKLGLTASAYGLFGLLIAAATVISARFGYAKSCCCSHEVIIKTGVLSVLVGSGLLTLVSISGILGDRGFGITIASISYFIIFFGIGLIIPNSISHALKTYTNMAGTAGSLFGFAYYIIIALCTYSLSLLHTGSLVCLPIYMLLLGSILGLGSFLIKSKKEVYNTKY